MGGGAILGKLLPVWVFIYPFGFLITHLSNFVPGIAPKEDWLKSTVLGVSALDDAEGRRGHDQLALRASFLPRRSS